MINVINLNEKLEDVDINSLHKAYYSQYFLTIDGFDIQILHPGGYVDHYWIRNNDFYHNPFGPAMFFILNKNNNSTRRTLYRYYLYSQVFKKQHYMLLIL